MANNRRTIVRKYTVENHPEANEIRVEVYYHIGGMSYLAGRMEKRGFNLSVTPLNVSEGWTTYRGFSGVKMFLQEASRFSQKALDRVVANLSEDEIQRVLSSVLVSNNISPDSITLIE